MNVNFFFDMKKALFSFSEKEGVEGMCLTKA